MTNSTRFSLRRFGQVLRLNTAEGYNSALRHYGAAYLFFFIVLAFGKFFIPYAEVFRDAGEKELEIAAIMMAQSLGIFGFFATLFLLLVSIGSCFSSGRSSLSGRMRQMMLPASTLEKFCAVMFNHTLIAAVCFVLLFIAADASTVLLSKMLDVEVAWSTPVYLSTLIYPQFGDVAGYGFAGPIAPHDLLHRAVEHVSIGRIGFPLQVFCADFGSYDSRIHPLLSALRLGCLHDEGKFQFLLQRSGG